MMLEVSSQVLDALLAEAERASPHECCGILLGEGQRIEAATPTANVHPASETHFEIDPQALVDAHRAARKGAAQVLGYYHSHPNGLARPSSTDTALMTRQGLIWAIIAAGRVSFWREGDAGFAKLPYVATNR